jgi:DNA-binding HxlR family transcriptional regulator
LITASTPTSPTPLPRSARMDPACPMAAFPFQVGGKWTGMVIIALADGPRRFTQLRSTLATVTAKVLTQTLRDMQRDGLAVRHDHDTNPPHVEYQLTDLGRSLITVIDTMRAWSDQHLEQLLTHRDTHRTECS